MAGDSVIVMFNGTPYWGWKSVKTKTDFDQATGEGTVVISEQPGNPLPVKQGDSAVLIIAGVPKVTGYVHKISAGHNFTTHPITINIRDKTHDMTDSTVGPGVEFKPPVALKTMYRKTLDKMGMSDIKVIDNVGPEPFRQGGEVPVAKVDDTGHGFLDRWAQKRQVVTHPDGKGNIVIDRNQNKKSGGHLTKAFEDGIVNNVLDAQFETSDYGRHGMTGVAAQKSTNDKDYWETRPKSDEPAQAEPLSSEWGLIQDSAIRSQRRKHIRAREGIEGTTPLDAAKWQSNLSRARGYTYSAEVAGFEAAPGELWEVGKTIAVRDDHFLISDELFIKSVEFSKDWGGGAKSKISCTYKDAFTTSAQGKPTGRTSKPGFGTSSVGDFEGDFSSIDYGSFGGE